MVFIISVKSLKNLQDMCHISGAFANSQFVSGASVVNPMLLPALGNAH
jgi:hypothetical protein